MGARILVPVVLVLICPGTRAAAANGRPRPDVVVILADDLGWGDLSCYDARAEETPNLDGIARRGVRFTAAWAPAAVCSPSRYGMLTGRYPWRDGVTDYLGSGTQPGNTTDVVLPGTETLASYLRAQGYATALFGKWHLGFGSANDPQPLSPGPLDAGFDRFFGWAGSPEGGARWVRDREWVGWKDGKVIPVSADTPVELTKVLPGPAVDALVSQIGAFLAEEAGRPVFLWIATYQVHKPWLTAPRFRPQPGEGQYAACVRELDWFVGRVLDLLEAAGRRSDALILFASDNGGTEDVQSLGGPRRPNGDLRGRKGKIWEGGIRVPLLLEGPEGPGAGVVRDDPVSLVDVAATVAAALGDTLPPSLATDGTSLLRPPDGPRPSPVIAASSGARAYAVRQGAWKLVRLGHGPAELFNLQEDPGETEDRAAERPDVVSALNALLDAAGVPEPPPGKATVPSAPPPDD